MYLFNGYLVKQAIIFFLFDPLIKHVNITLCIVLCPFVMRTEEVEMVT